MKIRLPEYRNAHVLVVGDVILDRYWYGSSHRISPEAPVPIVNVEQKEARPGGAANVATNMASLGANVHLIGLTGVDKAADTLREQLRAAGVKSDLIAVPTHSTLTKLRVISRNQQLIRLDFEACFQNVEPAALLALIQCQLLTSPSALVLSDYNKGTLSSIQPIIQLSRAVGIPVLVDPKGNDFERYRGATVLTPNLAEFEAVVGRCASEQELVNKGLQLMADYDFQALLITRSEQGMTLFKSQQAPLHIPAQAQAVCDVTGAGDTVIAVLAASLAAGTPLDIACQFANTAAGLVVSKLGAASVSLIELENNISGRFDHGFGILSETELQQALVQARSRGERIVMTNGCFDILHAGHVAYLEQARQLGDRLIVAVNSDASVQRLKGEQRPINPLQCRMQVLAALSAVDWVVPFSEQTPHRLISEILPDILVKGGDYQPETIVGAETVLAAGGSVQVLHFEENCSTSAIIQTIRQSL